MFAALHQKIWLVISSCDAIPVRRCGHHGRRRYVHNKNIVSEFHLVNSAKFSEKKREFHV